MKNLRPHQCNVLLVVAGIMIGACLLYFFDQKNVNYIKDQAYQEGFYEGRDSTTKQIIREIYEADSTVITENEIRMYYKCTTNEILYTRIRRISFGI